MVVYSKLASGRMMSAARFPLFLPWTFAPCVTKMREQEKLIPKTQE